MRFKLVKFCSKYFARFSLLSIAFLQLPLARAVITVTPRNGGSGSGPTVQGGSIFYFSSNGTAATPTAPSFIRFTPLDLRQGSSSDSVNGFVNMIRVRVTTDQPIKLSAGQRAVVTFFANPNTGTAHPAPIAAVNGTICSRANANCAALNQNAAANPSPGVDRFYAVNYNPADGGVEVGFYPTDVCDDAFAVTSSPVTGCTSSRPSRVNDFTSNQSLVLSFSISTAPDFANTTVPGSAIDSMTGSVNFTFITGSSGFTCPPMTSINYFPGDKQIFLDTSIFSLAAPAGGGAPLANLAVVGKIGGVPDISSSFASRNDLVSSAGAGIVNAPVTGFLNSTASQSFSYNLSFIAQDAAGIFSPPASVAACTLQGVRTSSIVGFLPTGTKNCFIATAAFGSADSTPVVLLRAFRDQFLMPHAWGQKFIRWYYRWSPGAANWLVEFPVFRIPVLVLLLPIEAIAWFCLNPGVGLLALLGVLLVGGWVAYFLTRKRESSVRNT